MQRFNVMYYFAQQVMYYFNARVNQCITLVQGEPNGIAFVMTTKPEIAPRMASIRIGNEPPAPAGYDYYEPNEPDSSCRLPAGPQSLRLSNEKRLSGEGGASCTIQKMPGSQETRPPKWGCRLTVVPDAD